MDKWIKENQQTLFTRLTTDTPKETILNDLKPHYKKIIISQEIASKQHYHILLTHEDSNSKNANQNLKNLLLKLYPQMKGNKDYAITETRQGTLTRLAAYTVKDGDFISHGFTSEELKLFKMLSYKKYTKKEFSDSLNKIIETWITNQKPSQFMTEQDRDNDLQLLVNQYITLKVEYNQNLNYTTIVNYINLIYAKKYGTQMAVDSVMTKFYFQRGSKSIN